ncbi:MAG: hypothetical protein QM535_22685, partial [Limnohabitans sp.]|nr:hypothetical protein [Limnohabitans sp.]
LELLNHHNLMYHIAGISNRKELDKFSSLIRRKDNKLKNFKKKLLKHNYIMKKSNKFLTMCNEKLFKAASIVKENEEKYGMTKDNFVKTVKIMKETEEKLNICERELIHFPAISYHIDKKTDNLYVDEVYDKDFNEMSIDELIYTYWNHIDNSSSELEDKTYEKDFEYMSIICDK